MKKIGVFLLFVFSLVGAYGFDNLEIIPCKTNTGNELFGIFDRSSMKDTSENGKVFSWAFPTKVFQGYDSSLSEKEVIEAVFSDSLLLSRERRYVFFSWIFPRRYFVEEWAKFSAGFVKRDIKNEVDMTVFPLENIIFLFFLLIVSSFYAQFNYHEKIPNNNLVFWISGIFSVIPFLLWIIFSNIIAKTNVLVSIIINSFCVAFFMLFSFMLMLISGIVFEKITKKRLDENVAMNLVMIFFMLFISCFPAINELRGVFHFSLGLYFSLVGMMMLIVVNFIFSIFFKKE